MWNVPNSGDGDRANPAYSHLSFTVIITMLVWWIR